MANKGSSENAKVTNRVILFGTNIETFELGVKIDKSNATITAPSQFTISTNGIKKTINTSESELNEVLDDCFV